MKNYITGWALDRISKNKNAIIVFVGPTGSGKSYAVLDTCLDIATHNKTHFTVQDNFSFKYNELVGKTDLKDNKAPGTCFCFEEFGAYGGGGSARDWQSQANKLFFAFMQTARHQQQVLFFTVPDFSFIDVGARKLTHMVVTMAHINFKQRLSYGIPYLLQTNMLTGKIYKKHLRYTINGITSRLDSQAFNLPPDDTIKAYEAMKQAFSNELRHNIAGTKALQARKEYTTIKDVDKFKKCVNSGIPIGDIAKLFNINIQTVYARKRALLEKENVPLVMV